MGSARLQQHLEVAMRGTRNEDSTASRTNLKATQGCGTAILAVTISVFIILIISDQMTNDK